MENIKRVNFSKKVVNLYTILFSIILFLILTLVYMLLLDASLNEKKLTSEMLINQPLKQIENFISEMDSVAYKAMTDEKLIKEFSNLRDDGNYGNYFEKNILDAIDIASLLANINGSYAPHWRVSAYNNYGDFISTGAITEKVCVDRELSSKDILNLMEKFKNNKDEFEVLSPMVDRWSSYFKSNYISLKRPIMNIYSRDIVGVVEVQENIKSIEEKISFELNKNLFVNIYDKDENAIIIQSQSDEYRIVASTVVDKLNWRIDLLEPAFIFKREMFNIFTIMLLAWIVLTLIIRIIITQIAISITKPLIKLKDDVNKIGAQNPGKLDTSHIAIDEIYQVANSFNNLLELKSFLVDQEKKSFFFAIQAHMNPHFLYNVLSVINAAAINNDSKIIVGICKNLSEMLRYNSSFENNLVTLVEEIKQTKAYLELMKARYEDMFSYSVNVSESLNKEKLPKLTIQPLCENCFKHAFSDIEPPYKIEINIQDEVNYWKIEVIDNGIGFTEKARDIAIDRANNTSYEDLSKMQIGGFGLISSLVRLKLYKQNNVTCEIENLSEGGAKVSIKISLSQELVL